MELARAGLNPEATRVETPEAFAEALDGGGQSWDVVIADYRLPGWSGLRALDMMQERAIDLPFIIVSGAIGEETAVDAMKAGAHDYVLKDNLVRLVPAIERERREAGLRRERRQALASLEKMAEQSAVAGGGEPPPGRAHWITTRRSRRPPGSASRRSRTGAC